MSVKIKTIEMELDDIPSMEELANSITEKLIFYREKHPEFSFSVERHYDTSKLVIKNCNLHESVN